jgi:DNA ligase (NAD+)
MEGFGEKSYANLIASVDKARSTTLAKVVYGLGIAGIGLANAKLICRHFKNDVEKMTGASEEELSDIQGVGPVLAAAFVKYFVSEERKKEFKLLLGELEIQPEEMAEEQKFAGMSFVVTGSVNHFANRNEIKELVEKMGGKVTGSVTKKTNYLINNDVESASSKNRKAKELGVPIISEEEFIELAGVEIE